MDEDRRDEVEKGSVPPRCRCWIDCRPRCCETAFKAMGPGGGSTTRLLSKEEKGGLVMQQIEGHLALTEDAGGFVAVQRAVTAKKGLGGGHRARTGTCLTSVDLEGDVVISDLRWSASGCFPSGCSLM